MRILFITDYLPYPLISGDQIRVYNLIQRIAKHHDVALAAFLASAEQAKAIAHLEELGCKVITNTIGEHRHPLAHLPGLVRFGLAGTPLELKFLYSQELAKKIRNLATAIDFDIVQIEKERMALYLEALPLREECKKILVFHNISSVQFARIARVTRRPIKKLRALLHSLQTRRWEPRYAERFDRCATLTAVDRRILLAANPRLQVDIIPTGIDTQIYHPLPQDNIMPKFLFIGSMNYSPNIDAVLYFCHEIFPYIRRMLGVAEFWIVGNNPVPEVRRLSGDSVYVTGRVEDILPYYAKTSICVVPLRAGSGIRGKILEAMALGRPVVSTSIGCEGIEIEDGKHLLIADSPLEFAKAAVRLVTDKKTYRSITAEAREYVVAKYDWEDIVDKLLRIYEELARSCNP